MNDIMTIVKSPEESGLLRKGVSQTIKNETKELKGGFLEMLLDFLGTSLLGNLSAGCKANKPGRETIRAGEGAIGVGHYF